MSPAEIEFSEPGAVNEEGTNYGRNFVLNMSIMRYAREW